MSITRQGLQQAVVFQDREFENKSPFAYVNVIYWTGNVFFGAYKSDPVYDAGDNSIVNEKTYNAYISQSFDFPLVDKSSDWLVAVERFEIYTQGLPMIRYENTDFFWYDTDANASVDWNAKIQQVDGVSYTVADLRADVNAVGTTVASGLNVGFYSFSTLDDFLEFLNTTFANAGANFSLYSFGTWKNGHILMYQKSGPFWGEDVTNRLYMTPNLKEILGNFTWNRSTYLSGEGAYQSQFNRLDLIDRLSHVRIESNLSTTSDILGSSSGSTLTDFSIVQDQSISLTDGDIGVWTRNQALHQKIVYIPSYPRYSVMSDGAPIRNLRITPKAIDRNNNEKLIPMPAGSSMNIKLSFTKRVAY